jgi:hypothetical protein
MTSTSQAQLSTRSRTPSRGIGLAMVAEAATFAIASAIHFGAGFTQAAIPELIIAAVLAAGSSAVLTRRAHAWGVAVGTAAFATFGTAVGLEPVFAGDASASGTLGALLPLWFALVKHADGNRRVALCIVQ